MTITKSFGDLLKKYQAWVVDQSVLDSLTDDTLTIKVEEENGTIRPDNYHFSISRDLLADIITSCKTFTTEEGQKKYIIPLSRWTLQTDVESAKKRIQQLGVEWYFKLRAEFHKDYMKDLSYNLQAERKKHVIYPASPDVFRALRITPFSSVKVVAIGQNPYHNGLADGLAFSSLNELIIPKSLQNIFKEIENDVYNGLMLDQNPVLDRWARQGVLLINTSLTVREGQADSHFDLGWEQFTGEIISRLYEANRPIVWLLWGNEAQKSFDSVIAKFGGINDRHLVLRAAHPSPLSANRGFFGCKHFSKTNKFLESNGLRGIEW